MQLAAQTSPGTSAFPHQFPQPGQIFRLQTDFPLPRLPAIQCPGAVHSGGQLRRQSAKTRTIHSKRQIQAFVAHLRPEPGLPIQRVPGQMQVSQSPGGLTQAQAGWRLQTYIAGAVAAVQLQCVDCPLPDQFRLAAHAPAGAQLQLIVAKEPGRKIQQVLLPITAHLEREFFGQPDLSGQIESGQ